MDLKPILVVRRVLLLMQMNLYHFCLSIVSCSLDMNETVYEEYILHHNKSISKEEFCD